MSGAACPDCGTIDERGPHTIQNCKGVIMHREAQLAAQIVHREMQLAVQLAAVARRVETAEARVLELERRFPVVPCPKCGTIAKRGAAHTHGFVTGSRVVQESCDGLEG